MQERGELTPAAFEKALASVGRLVSAAREMGADALVVVGTSALREARNGGAFVEACRERFGVDVRVLTGDEEARFSYLGASSANRFSWGRVLLADLGGGSVESPRAKDRDVTRCSRCRSGFFAWRASFPHRKGRRCSASPTMSTRSAKRRVPNRVASIRCSSQAGAPAPWASFFGGRTPRSWAP